VSRVCGYEEGYGEGIYVGFGAKGKKYLNIFILKRLFLKETIKRGDPR